MKKISILFLLSVSFFITFSQNLIKNSTEWVDTISPIGLGDNWMVNENVQFQIIYDTGSFNDIPYQKLNGSEIGSEIEFSQQLELSNTYQDSYDLYFEFKSNSTVRVYFDDEVLAFLPYSGYDGVISVYTQILNYPNDSIHFLKIKCQNFLEIDGVYLTNVSTKKLSGKVIYDNEYGFGLSNSKVILKNISGIPVDSVFVQDDGYYEFFNNIDSGEYVVTASSLYPWGGSNSTDALIVKNHIIGSNNINNLYGNLSFLASDINNTNTLSGLDALYIQLRTVQLIDSFPSGNWIFSTDTITIDSYSFDLHMNVKGLCYGDVNKSYNPTSKSTILPIYLETQINQKDEEFLYDIIINNEISALSLVLSYDTNIFDIIEATSKNGELFYKNSNGYLRISWVGDEQSTSPVILKMKQKIIGENIEPFNINYLEASNYFGGMIVTNIYLKKISSVENIEDIILYPNPFSDILNISNIENSENSKIVIFDLNGEIIKTINNLTSEIYLGDLKNGVYICKIIQNEKIQVLRIMKIK